jgi:thiol-disulfide isomerase/thioredoxin
MRKFVFLLVICWTKINVAKAQEVPLVKWDAVQKILSKPSDTTYILNFWATWCAPCVAELPDFEKAHQQLLQKKVRIVMISTDFVKDLEMRVKPFIKNKKLTSRVWLLNEPDYNSWINKVNQHWSGTIPATLIINTKQKKKLFIEEPVKYDRLIKELADFL